MIDQNVVVARSANHAVDSVGELVVSGFAGVPAARFGAAERHLSTSNKWTSGEESTFPLKPDSTTRNARKRLAAS